MRISDPRGAGFNEAQFRDAIKFAMKMGTPEAVNLRPTFRWTTVKTFTKADSGGKPWTKNATPIATESRPDVQIDCAVEFVTRSTLSGGTAIGDFDTPRAKLTVLDVDYASIEGADQVILGGNTYKVDFVAPPDGLFGVTVYYIHCSAVDES